MGGKPSRSPAFESATRDWSEREVTQFTDNVTTMKAGRAHIEKKEFCKALDCLSEKLAEVVFQSFRPRDGCLDEDDVATGVNALARSGFRDKSDVLYCGVKHENRVTKVELISFLSTFVSFATGTNDNEFASAMVAAGDHDDEFSSQQFSLWIKATCPHVVNVFATAVESFLTRGVRDASPPLSLCPVLQSAAAETVLLKPAHAWFLAPFLPDVSLRREWTLMYSSGEHGHSYNRFAHHAQGCGPTVTIVVTDDGRIFGAYNAESFAEPSSEFCGTMHGFLFSLRPAPAIHRPTGRDSNYVYHNAYTNSFPNGIGFGGQHERFGFFIEQSFDTGYCKDVASNTTYGCPPLSGSEDEFNIDWIEVWRVDPSVVEQVTDGQGKSVLDKHKDAQAVLELAGIQRNSAGLRDPDEA